MSLPLLLEIGTEEIPDWMIVQALNQLQDRVAQVARPSRIRADATPRRLVIRAEGLIEKRARQSKSYCWVRRNRLAPARLQDLPKRWAQRLIRAWH